MAQQSDVKTPEAFGEHDSNRYTVTGNVVKSKDDNHGCVYGSKSVSSGCHEWVIKYENSGHRCCGAIGIASHSAKTTVWGYSTATSVCFYHEKAGSNNRQLNYSGSTQSDAVKTKLLSGDTVRILLNYDKKIITFYDTNKNVIFSVDDLPTDGIAYRLWVDGDGNDDKYTILKSYNSSIFISLEDASLALNVINVAVGNANKIIKEMSMEQLSKMKQQTSEFLDECKEFEQDFENIKIAVALLDKKVDGEMNPDTKNYKSWKVEQICRYVLSLENQRFAKYMDALSAALEKQQICGGDLPEIEANDLYTMGIDNFKDRKCLAKYFKNLDTNEGNIATEHH